MDSVLHHVVAFFMTLKILRFLNRFRSKYISFKFKVSINERCGFSQGPNTFRLISGVSQWNVRQRLCLDSDVYPGCQLNI